ncbi:hypothetical protein [Planotetraspora kaengkrachanensis]|uniref:Lipoprotein n=1 Tax=Planotetraspora kaengkrachanensis TaxID=575193 RepID=A0A8J3VCR3_9ACTN|nr:hypothetical protein [Planotetraspora kaengkrachanensis]GIG85002.1 hypothetical protein Pka01_81290 [Planotetraspora kaengkrachanensis]
MVADIVVSKGRLGVASVAVAALAALVAGCGSEPAQGFRPTPEAAPASTAAASPSTAASPSAAPAAGPAFPSDFKVVYQAETPQPKAAKAVKDFGDFWNAWWYSISTEGKDKRYLDYVASGSAVYGTDLFDRVVSGWKAENVRPTGVVRVHDLHTLSVSAKSVTLVGCGDESKAGTKNLTTGKVSWTFGKQKTSRYKIRVIMVPGSEGLWRVRAYQPVSVTSSSGGECR